MWYSNKTLQGMKSTFSQECTASLHEIHKKSFDNEDKHRLKQFSILTQVHPKT